VPPLTATAGQPLALSLFATDDGKTRSQARAAAANRAPVVNVTWTKYRGPGTVTFANAKPAVDKDSHQAQTTATFSEPGAYVLRVVGNDAFIRFIITKSFDENFAHVGDRAVFWVRDGGPGGADVGHSGPAPFLDPGNTICTTTPAALSPDAISGNFIVH